MKSPWVKKRGKDVLGSTLLTKNLKQQMPFAEAAGETPLIQESISS